MIRKLGICQGCSQNNREEMYRDKLLRGGGGGGGPRAAQMSPWGEAARKLTVIYNRKSDVFDHFGSAFNNTKFILFCSFLKISLQTTAADPEILDLDLLTGGGGGGGSAMEQYFQ